MKNSNSPLTTNSNPNTCKRIRENHPLALKKSKAVTRAAFVEVRSLDQPLVSPVTGSPVTCIRLEADRPYTIGRASHSSDFVFDSKFVSKQHCQILFDSVDRKLYVLDGVVLLDSLGSVVGQFRGRAFGGRELEEEKEKVEEVSGVRASRNGICVNGVRIKKGMVVELFAGDEILLACTNEHSCCLPARVGFWIQEIVFKEEVVSETKEVMAEKQQLLETVTSVYSQGTPSSGSRSKRVFAIPSNSMSAKKGGYWPKSKTSSVIARIHYLLDHCRQILQSNDPISSIQQWDMLHFQRKRMYGDSFPSPAAGRKINFLIGSEEEVSNMFPVCHQEHRLCGEGSRIRQSSSVSTRSKVGALVVNHELADCSVPHNEVLEVESSMVIAGNTVSNYETGTLSNVVSDNGNGKSIDASGKNKRWTNSCSAPGKKFYLNRLGFMDSNPSDQHHVVSLPELLYPVETISRIFIATFTCDIVWFLSYCKIPCHLPVTVACHNAERCWSSSLDSRSCLPLPEFPNLFLVFPPFSEGVAFGNDRKRRGIACHHPKLFVLQRDDSIRVIITSANLVEKQWENVTNTIWWQDFPCRSEPDYSSLFPLHGGGLSLHSRPDFAAQLAGFLASLIVDVPSQAHWINELAKYDFMSAEGHLVASIPGIHSQVSPFRTLDIAPEPDQASPSSVDGKFLGVVDASVVGLSHLFRTAVDSNGARLKKLASFLGKPCKNANEMSMVVLRRLTNINVDVNAVSILVISPDGIDDVQLGFLPRDTAKWVSPLWDSGFFEFSGYLHPDEALEAAFGEDKKKVQLILHVSQGQYFTEMSKMMQPRHIVALSCLIASIKRCLGIWRLQEVLSQCKWPDSRETEFVYGASSIGSVNAQFLAAFAAAAGKKSVQDSDSEESDPEWGCWTASQELRRPSIRIIYPTIERVKNACNGISPSRHLLCFSEKTWQRLSTARILHDAVPHPQSRTGHPMHVKVAVRRFRSETDASYFGWVYCGSHNFSMAAWGRSISSAGVKAKVSEKSNSTSSLRLHICNYELGIVFMFPQSEIKSCSSKNSATLDGISLPFVVPAPKYRPSDRPATPQAMRQALAELSERNRGVEAETLEEPAEEIPDEDEDDEASAAYVEEAKEEDKSYADMLWNRIDSSKSC